jgi:hypothetical protein
MSASDAFRREAHAIWEAKWIEAYASAEQQEIVG